MSALCNEAAAVFLVMLLTYETKDRCNDEEDASPFGFWVLNFYEDSKQCRCEEQADAFKELKSMNFGDVTKSLEQTALAWIVANAKCEYWREARVAH